jgi:hypothetical protein
VVEGWGIFSNKAFYSWCERALGQGGLLWKIPGSRDFVCNLYFPNRASLVVTLGKAALSGDYAVDLGLCPQVLQHDGLIGVPYPKHKFQNT